MTEGPGDEVLLQQLTFHRVAASYGASSETRCIHSDYCHDNETIKCQ